jgi:hypothetical protein
MHRTIEYVIECADPHCTARVVTTSHKKNVLCPDCREKRRRARQRRRAEEKALRKRNGAEEKTYDPDTWLEKKLDGADYCIVHDAGPPEESFPENARITGEELKSLLDNAYLEPGSLVYHLSCSQLHLVAQCQQTGKLHLKPVPIPPRLL